MNPDNPEMWHVHPLVLRFVTTPMAILALVVGVIVVWLVVSWWTDWRWRN